RHLRCRFVREQILGHGGRLFGQLEIAMALDALARGGRCLAAADRAKRLTLSDAIADLDAQPDDLPRERREHAREPVLLALILARDSERLRDLAFGGRLDLDRREHLVVERERAV